MGDALPVIPTPALIAEGTRRAGVIWLAVPGQNRPVPAWHIWRDPPGAAYVATGPGEQPLPGMAGAARVTVTVPSKDTGGALVTWTAGVHRVESGVTGVGRGHRPAGGRPAQRRPGPRLGDGIPARPGAARRVTLRAGTAGGVTAVHRLAPESSSD